MIVPMKKVTVLASATSREVMLEALGKLGLLHLVPAVSPAPVAKGGPELEECLETLRKAADGNPAREAEDGFMPCFLSVGSAGQ